MMLAAGLGMRMRPIARDHAKAAGAGRGPQPCSTTRPRHARRRGYREGRRQRPPFCRSRSWRMSASRTRPRVVISDESAGGCFDSAGGIVKALAELGGRSPSTSSTPTPSGSKNAASPISSGGSRLHGIRPRDRYSDHSWRRHPHPRRAIAAAPTSCSASRTIGSSAPPRGRPRGRPLIYAGAAIVRPHLRGRRSRRAAYSLNLYFDRAIAAGRLFGMRMDGHWITVGTRDAIPLAEAAHRQRRAAAGAVSERRHPEEVFSIRQARRSCRRSLMPFSSGAFSPRIRLGSRSARARRHHHLSCRRAAPHANCAASLPNASAGRARSCPWSGRSARGFRQRGEPRRLRAGKRSGRAAARAADRPARASAEIGAAGGAASAWKSSLPPYIAAKFEEEVKITCRPRRRTRGSGWRATFQR